MNATCPPSCSRVSSTPDPRDGKKRIPGSRLTLPLKLVEPARERSERLSRNHPAAEKQTQPQVTTVSTRPQHQEDPRPQELPTQLNALGSCGKPTATPATNRSAAGHEFCDSSQCPDPLIRFGCRVIDLWMSSTVLSAAETAFTPGFNPRSGAASRMKSDGNGNKPRQRPNP